MKIGILTQPLRHNYGGILQAFALQEILRSNKHDVIVINREYIPRKMSLLRKVLVFVKDITKSFVYGYPYFTPSPELINKITNNTTEFINKHIILSKKIYDNNILQKYIKDEGFDALVVGSDQVWRPMYSPNIYNYYLDVADNLNLKRIAYAASFGVANWEYNQEQTIRCGELLKKFDFVGVREQSGVILCKKHYGVDATVVLDPTLLHDRFFYLNLIDSLDRKQKNNPVLFSYILDDNKLLNNKIHHFAQKYNLSISRSLPSRKPSNWRVKKHLQDYMFPSPSQWLKNFDDARVVITDSFHGTAFSIIFNKTFWVLGNKNRGMDRFVSLLSLFGLENRLVTLDELENKNFYENIDWKDVNERWATYRKESLKLLFDIINGEN